MADLRARLRRLRSEAVSSRGWTQEQIRKFSALVEDVKNLSGPNPSLVQLEGLLVAATWSLEQLDRFNAALGAESTMLDALDSALDLWDEKDLDRLSDAVGSLRSRIVNLEKQR